MIIGAGGNAREILDILDACNEVVWKDDRQIFELSVGKHIAQDKKHVGVAMTVSPVKLVDRVRSP